MKLKDNNIYRGLMERDENYLADFVCEYEWFMYEAAKKYLGSHGNDIVISECVSNAIIFIWDHIHMYQEEKYSFRTWVGMVVISMAKLQIQKLLRTV